MRPDFDDLPAFARHEAEDDAPGGWLRPRLLLFHAGEPTVYVRARAARDGEPPREALSSVLREMAAIAPFVRPDAAAVLLQVSMAPGDGPTRAAEDPLGEEAVLVQRGWCDGTPGASVEGDATLLRFGRDDTGAIRWGSPVAADGGPCDVLLGSALGQGPALLGDDHPGLGAAGAVYALTKFGHVLAVDAAWRDRFGLGDAPEPDFVRPADRHLARRLQRQAPQHRAHGAGR